MSRVPRLLGPTRRHPERLPFPLAVAFFRIRRGVSPKPAAWWLASILRVRRWSEAVDVDRGPLVSRRLKDVAVIMELHEFAPVGTRAASRRERRWFSVEPKRCKKEMAPSRWRAAAGASVVTSAAALNSRSSVEVYPASSAGGAGSW